MREWYRVGGYEKKFTMEVLPYLPMILGEVGSGSIALAIKYLRLRLLTHQALQHC
jgi:hypothetical protein